ncbi:MAG TPA: hypothetical protein PLZ43_16355, partial [bacterium]|nr:hypothetical protein [bacterium]
VQTNGCREWDSTVKNCLSGYICNFSNNQCESETPVCSPTCSSLGAKQCNGNGYQTCEDTDTSSAQCLKWGSVTNCESTQTCEDGICKNQVIPQCTSGVCCDTSTNKYKNSSVTCDTTYEYKCDPVGCTGKAQKRKIDTKCSGNFSSCNGSTVSGSWSVIDTCDSTEKCFQNSSDAYCQSDSSCFTCTDKCELGEKQCINASSGEQCVMGDNGCTEWGGGFGCLEGICAQGECRVAFNYNVAHYCSDAGSIKCDETTLECSKYTNTYSGMVSVLDSTTSGRSWKILRNSNGYVSVCFNPGSEVISWTEAAVRVEVRGQEEAITGSICGTYQIYKGASLGAKTTIIKPSTELLSDSYSWSDWADIAPSLGSNKVCVTVTNGNDDCLASTDDDLRLYNIEIELKGVRQ